MDHHRSPPVANAVLELIDTQGSTVLQTKGHVSELDIRVLSPGRYCLVVRSPQHVSYLPVIKE